LASQKRQLQAAAFRWPLLTCYALAAFYVLGSVVLSIVGLFAGLALIRGLVGAA
jgi:hypothetical protein